MNQVRVRADFDLGPAVESVARRALGIPVRFLGAIAADDAIWKSVRSGRPLLVEAPSSKPAREIERIARWILLPDAAQRAPVPRLREPGGDENLYEALEVDRGATEEEIRRAYRRAKDLYGGTHVATRGHVSPADLRRLLARAEEAYETLVDIHQRRPYDRSLHESEGGEPLPISPGPQARRRGGAMAARSEPVEQGTEFTARCRDSRRQRGWSATTGRRDAHGTAHCGRSRRRTSTRYPRRSSPRATLRQLARVLALPERDVIDAYLRRFCRPQEGRKR